MHGGDAIAHAGRAEGGIRGELPTAVGGSPMYWAAAEVSKLAPRMLAAVMTGVMWNILDP